MHSARLSHNPSIAPTMIKTVRDLKHYPPIIKVLQTSATSQFLSQKHNTST